MPPRRLFWQLLLPFLLVIFSALAAVTWFATRTQSQFWLAHTERTLEARARLVARQFRDLVAAGDAHEVDLLCQDFGVESATRLTVITADGTVWGDSYENPKQMDNHADRPEVRDALSGSIGSSTRFSRTLRETLMYVTVPLEQDGAVIGVVRASIPVTFIDRVLGAFRREIAFAGLITALVATLMSLAISRRITKPLVALTRGAQLFARGDFTHKLEVPASDEIGGLALAMNEMAEQLGERIAAVERQRQEQKAIFSSMAEGIIAVDTTARIISLNAAAAEQFGVDSDLAPGRKMSEVVEAAELRRFIEDTLAGQTPLEREITLHHNSERHVRVLGTALRDAQQAVAGAVVVCNDITRLRRLENVRRDFVANVSHELRTPITSIKGFVETLLDGTLQETDESRRFLEIIASQADRLNAIIEDLLSLSRLEQEEQQGPVTFEEGGLDAVLRAAALACEVKARRGGVTLDLKGVPALRARFNAALLEQAFINLIDNAIKYSGPDSIVRLQIRESGREVAIDVIDQGCGIPSEHLSRVFERFYRVDKARSHKLGGTGLGLAIVKHIAQAHGGSVEVQSDPGRGSTFTIRLPLDF